MKPRKKNRADGSTYWLARWFDPEASTPTKRVVHSKAFPTKKAAEDYQAQMTVAKATGLYTDPTLGRTTLQAWWDRFSEVTAPSLKPSTVETYRARMTVHVLPHLGKRQLANLKRMDIEAWVGKLDQDGIKPANVRAAHAVLRRVLQSAMDAGVIGRNPALGVKTPKASRQEMRVLTPAEIQAIADAVHPRNRALVLLLAYAGLRIGEATALRADNLNLLQGRVQVVEAYSEVGGKLVLGSTKTAGSRRVVTLPGFVTQALRDHLEAFPVGPNGLVFTAPQGGAIRRTAFYHRVWIPALRAAGIQGHVRPHDLRHTAVSLAIQVGAHPKEIQARAGHSSITVTMDRYGHLFPGQDVLLADKLDALVGGLAAPVGPELAPEGQGKVVAIR